MALSPKKFATQLRVLWLKMLNDLDTQGIVNTLWALATMDMRWRELEI
ncbi:hypothetical protein [Coxiella endosymbiont of Ornithodoros amblus]|nr:hypothetical protein [Coxiella endosymbiont of Ornithodoros amblus]